MKIISPANDTVLAILKKFKKSGGEGRLIKYCVQTPVDGGLLLHNGLTRETLLLTEAEARDLTGNVYLRERWFVVPHSCNEKELTDLVRWVIQSRRKKSPPITTYVLFTTTDCNARCFYCFEKGRSRISMSLETAEKVVRYIKEHCGGEKVTISWYGGEPLYNLQVIDTICDGLRREGIEYASVMISNGYLFDDATVAKARDSWRLKRVQIALDGTEAVYNRSKAFIYRDGSAYQVVMANIQRLLDASIKVIIRLNMGLHNAEDLLNLVEELGQRFGGQENIFVYAYHLFDGAQPLAERHSPEVWAQQDAAMCRLNEKIVQCGLVTRRGIAATLKTHNCMADAGGSVTILPTGDIGLCDHCSEDEFIGHIDREGFDEKVIASWRERAPEIPECVDCFYYPSCYQIKKCPNRSVCFEQMRLEYLRMVQRQMLNEYQRWQDRVASEEPEDDGLC